MTGPGGSSVTISAGAPATPHRDGAGSTGIFAGASGQGSDTAYPALDTAAPQGTLTLSR